MVQLRVEARDLGSIPSIGGHFRFGLHGTGLKIAEVYCMFAHPTCSLMVSPFRSLYLYKDI